MVDDPDTVAKIDALRRDDPDGVMRRYLELDPRTLFELGFDIVPLLSSGLHWRVLAVELNRVLWCMRRMHVHAPHAQ